MFFIIFWRPVTAIHNGDMDGKPLQSRTLRDRSETALQCGKVKRSPIPIEQARRRTLMWRHASAQHRRCIPAMLRMAVVTHRAWPAGPRNGSQRLARLEFCAGSG